MKRPTSKPKAATVIAVAYYRMSSDKQDKSIGSQRSEVEAYAKANGIDIIREYMDEGISGAESERRDGFQRLIHDAQNRADFQLILCWDQDRFSRFDPLEANHYWFLLKQAGVAIETVAQGRLEFGDLAGWLLASVNQAGKAQYLRDLSRNTTRGRRNAALRGEWPGRAPYGYAKKDGRLVLGDSEAIEGVRFLYQTYSEGNVSLRKMAQLLNERGIQAPNGGQWSANRIRNLLLRPTYKGEAVFNRIKRSKITRTTEVRAEEDWIVHKCPAIVSKELWEKAQERLHERRVHTTPHRNGGEYVLSGLLFCAECGSKMIGRWNKNESPWPGYICSGYSSRGRACCRYNRVRQADLLQFLIDRITSEILSPEVIDQLREEVDHQLQLQSAGKPKERQLLSRKIANLDKEVKSAAAELKRTPDDLYSLAVDHVRDLRSQRDRLVNRLNELESPQETNAELDVDSVMSVVQDLRNRVLDADPTLVRTALREVVERVDLEFEIRTEGRKRGKIQFSRGMVRWKHSDLFHSHR